MEQQTAVSGVPNAAPTRSRAPAWLRIVHPTVRVSGPSREALTQAALVRLHAAGEPCQLGPFWAALCSGKWRISELLSHGDESIALLEERSAADAAKHAVRGRRLEILERVLEGQSLNFVSLDLGVSNSTASAEFKRASKALGFGGRLADLPVLAAQLWFARKADSNIPAVTCRLEFGALQRLVLAVPRAELKLLECLSPAEGEVCRLLLQGCSHAEISISRNTNSRTTANQISSIFRKLGVSGRLDLLTKLVRISSVPPRRESHCFANTLAPLPIPPAQRERGAERGRVPLRICGAVS